MRRLGLAGIGKGIAAGAVLAVALGFAALQNAPADRPAPASRPAAVADVTAPCPGAGRLMVPVSGVRADQLVNTFDDARSEGRRHDAIDIMAGVGTPVVAAAGGRVEKLFLSRAGGNTVYVRSPDGRTIYYYAHLDRYAPGLREGQAVRQGTLLGTVGYTGNADPTAPHLHFAIMATTPAAKWWDGTRALNPFLPLTGRRKGGC